MIDYDFYVNSYLGSAIPEKAFSGVAARAAEALQYLRQRYQVQGDEISVKMALCAMAEVLYSQKKDGLTGATVGNVTVRYESGQSLRSRLLQQARIYLDVYRGATVWTAH